MRNFVREKKIYCGADYLEVDIYNYTQEERDNARRGVRSKKKVESTPKQAELNDINSKRYFLQLLNTNFGENDLHVTLTYTNKTLPPTYEDAERELNNFLRRVSYKRKKEGLPPIKYMALPPVCTYKKDGITPARIHHHIVMNGGLGRDEIEDLWRKRKKKGQKRAIKSALPTPTDYSRTKAGLRRFANTSQSKAAVKSVGDRRTTSTSPKKKSSTPTPRPKRN